METLKKQLRELVDQGMEKCRSGQGNETDLFLFRSLRALLTVSETRMNFNADRAKQWLNKKYD